LLLLEWRQNRRWLVHARGESRTGLRCLFLGSRPRSSSARAWGRGRARAVICVGTRRSGTRCWWHALRHRFRHSTVNLWLWLCSARAAAEFLSTPTELVSQSIHLLDKLVLCRDCLCVKSMPQRIASLDSLASSSSGPTASPPARRNSVPNGTASKTQDSITMRANMWRATERVDYPVHSLLRPLTLADSLYAELTPKRITSAPV
jgi:hypothetical protein